MMKDKFIIYGASGHGKVVVDIIEKCNLEILGFIDDDKGKMNENILGYKVLGGIEHLNNFNNPNVLVILGIGENQTRRLLSEKLERIGISIGTAIHPSSQIGRCVKIGEGTVIMANAVINSDTYIGRHCIINTSASVDHDCNVGNFVHIAPGVHIGGGVKIGIKTFIGLGTSIRNNISIGENSIIGAGSVVINDIENNVVYAGNPAKKIKDN